MGYPMGTADKPFLGSRWYLVFFFPRGGVYLTPLLFPLSTVPCVKSLSFLHIFCVIIGCSPYPLCLASDSLLPHPISGLTPAVSYLCLTSHSGGGGQGVHLSRFAGGALFPEHLENSGGRDRRRWMGNSDLPYSSGNHSLRMAHDNITVSGGFLFIMLGVVSRVQTKQCVCLPIIKVTSQASNRDHI